MGFDFSGVEIPQVVDSTHVLGRRLTDSGGRSAELGSYGQTVRGRVEMKRVGEVWKVGDSALR